MNPSFSNCHQPVVVHVLVFDDLPVIQSPPSEWSRAAQQRQHSKRSQFRELLEILAGWMDADNQSFAATPLAQRFS